MEPDFDRIDYYDDVDSANDSDEDDEEGMDLGIQSVVKYPYEVLSTEQIVEFFKECMQDVNKVLEIPTATARILLNHFKWDKEKLMERFYGGDQDKLFAEARVINPFMKKPPPKAKKRRLFSSGDEECGICASSFFPVEMTGLECGHRFCMQCWRDYLTSKIMQQGIAHTIACPAHKCDILVDDDTALKLIKDQTVKLKYKHLIINSFVECHRLLRWCPAPGCGNAVKVSFVKDTPPAPVVCLCGQSFCFGCGESWHDPVKCFMLLKWLKKCSDDSETTNWITANTKRCPKCNVIIEKNGGCNHITCTNQSCKNEFCWMCLGPWSQHLTDAYYCNRYVEDAEAREARKALKRSKAELKRYLHYFKRYMNHMQSLRFESKLNATVQEKMKQMQQHNMSWIEVQFLKKAVDVLCQCRQTLMHTYVFAYYLRKNNQSAIFEDNQSDLESATETLSEYLERDEIIPEGFADIKQKVQDKYRYCEKRREVLSEHVHEGYSMGWWNYL